jgi:sporulation protein YlmC with PRC-barrel domain
MIRRLTGKSIYDIRVDMKKNNINNLVIKKQFEIIRNKIYEINLKKQSKERDHEYVHYEHIDRMNDDHAVIIRYRDVIAGITKVRFEIIHETK